MVPMSHTLRRQRTFGPPKVREADEWQGPVLARRCLGNLSQLRHRNDRIGREIVSALRKTTATLLFDPRRAEDDCSIAAAADATALVRLGWTQEQEHRDLQIVEQYPWDSLRRGEEEGETADSAAAVLSRECSSGTDHALLPR